MAVVNSKSNAILNRDATPKVLTDPLISGGEVAHSYGWIFTTNADSAASTYRLVQVPSGAQLMALDLVNGALGSGCILDVAVWYPTVVQAGGGAFLSPAVASTLVSSSSLTVGIVGNTANTTYTSLLSTAQLGPNYWEMPLWMMIGLTADPECVLDIGFSVRVATATAGYVGMRALYSY